MLKHKYKISAVAICLLFFSLALFSSSGFNWKDLRYSGNGILADEIPHLSGGYYYLKTHRYFINPEHPPLVKDIAGLGELVASPAFPNIIDQEILPPNFHREEYPIRKAEFPKGLEWANNQDYFGVLFLFHPQNNPDQLAFWARLAVILTNTVLLLVLFTLVSRLESERTAFLGLFFFAVSPFAIGHGSYVVIDFMSAVLTIIALASFGLYLKKYAEGEKTLRYFILASVCFALALLSKFSSVVLLPAAFLGGLIFVLDVRRLKSFRGRTPTASAILKYFFAFLALMAAVAFLISIFYAFHIYKTEDYVLVQKLYENYPEEHLPQFGHKILEGMVYSNVLFKGLASYINGVFMVVSRMIVSAQITYFMGHVYGQEGAGWWYFPILYFTKLSPGFHLFTLLVLILSIKKSITTKRFWGRQKKRGLPFAKFSCLWRFHNTRNADFSPLTLLLWVFIIFYIAITLSSTFQIGLRHIMPVILATALLTGRGVDLFWETIFLKLNLRKILKFSFRMKHFFLAISVLMIISVFHSFPYYLQYYNIFAGGTDKGYKIATDSNYDWGGSDVRRLGKWTKDNNISEIYTQIFADVPLKYYLGDGQKNFNIRDGWLPPSGSYLAVSNYEYMNNVFASDIPPEQKFTIFENNLVARVGKTIFVYKVP